MAWMDTVRTVWPTVARTDEWAGGWVDGYILEPCQGPEGQYDSCGTVPGYSNWTSTDEARQDETSVLGPAGACWLGGAVICEM